MKMNNIKFLFLFLIVCAISLMSFRTNLKPSIKIFEYYDTTSFTPNSNSGWACLSNYFSAINQDTVEMELLLSNAPGTNWNKFQKVGKISSSGFIPKSEQELSYSLLFDNVWKLVIKPSGDVFLSQIRGDSPNGTPPLLPIKVRYGVK